MSYDVEAAKAAGHSDEDIANHLAQSHGYDVLSARKEGFSDADIIKHLAPMEVQPEAKQPSNIALPAELGLLGGAGATAYTVGDIGLKGTRNVVKKVEQLLEGLKKPETISAPAPTEFTGPKTPVDKYGKAMHGGVYSNTQDMSKMYRAGEEAQAFKSANPAWEVRQGSSIALPPDLKAAAAARVPQAAPGFLAKAQQMAEPIMSGVKSLGAPLKFAGKLLAPVAGAFEAGTQGGEAWNRGETGDTTGAVISGLGSLGSAAMMSGNPLIAVPGAAVSLAAPQINKYRDLMKQGHIKHEAPNYQNFDAMGNAYAQGGMVHLANGGEPNTAPFIGYPHIKNKPNDPNFVQQSGPILGGLDAVLGMGKRGDVSMLTPEGQAYHESYDKYEPAGIAANVLPFMGGPTKAVGKAAMRELGPKAAGMAEDYLTKIGGIQYAVPKSKVAARMPMQDNALNQTVDNPLRNAYPGIYKRPDVIAQEAAAKVAPEDPMLKQLFGVTRDDLYEMSKRQGNVPGFIPGASVNPKGSAAAESIMTPRNEQRLLDVLSEVKNKAPALHTGMHGWYTMDPQYHRMVELMGEEKAKQMYHRLNTFGGIESPNLPVPVEFNRASAANWLAEQGRMPDWIKYGGMRDKELVAGIPQDIIGVPGRVGHQRASASQQKFMDTGEHGMISPKAPPYIQASSVPELGFQTDLPVGDAHWSRFLGLPDVRTSKEVSASVSTPELQQLAPWFKNKIAGGSGLESVPAQAILWGAGSPQTGVKTAIGAGKLDLQATEIAKAAKRMGVSPETARDLILMGKARAGKKEGGPIDSYAPGGKVLSAIKKLSEEAQAAYKAKFTPGFYHGSPSNSIEAFDPTKSIKDEMFTTPHATFVSPNPKFAESYLSRPDKYTPSKGATMYPVSVNLGNHFDPATPEGSDLMKQYLMNKYQKEAGTHGFDEALNQKHEYMMDRLTDPVNNWKLLESPELINFLKSTGHNSFAVTEGGVKNVGVFNPADIRGKFAKFNPEHAADPDFMKAAGGSVEGYAPGGKVVGGLTELMQLIKQQGGTAAAKRLERAADLVPNLEHQYQPQALKEAFGSGNNSGIVVMNPNSFENYAAPLSESQRLSKNGYKIGEPSAESGYANVPWVGFNEKIKSLQQHVNPQTGTGFLSVPYLQLEQQHSRILPQIYGHEGRHRSEALSQLNTPSTIVQIKPVGELKGRAMGDSNQEFLENIKKLIGNPTIVKPETFTNPNKYTETISRKPIGLPEIFKKGGLV